MDETDNQLTPDQEYKMVKLMSYHDELEYQLRNVDFLSNDEKEWELRKFEQLAMDGQIFEV